MTLFGNPLWNGGANALIIGGNVRRQQHMLSVTGGLLTNFAVVTVGQSAGSSGNQLVIQQGGILSNFGGFVVGGSRVAPTATA